MGRIERFEDIVAWQRARVLVASVYRATRLPAFSADFALKDQIRRAVISIPSNIAEGFARYRPRELHQFLSVAKASCDEVRSHIYLAFDAGYIDESSLNGLLLEAEEVSSKIAAFRSSIERRYRLGRHRVRPGKIRARAESSISAHPSGET